MKRGDIVIVDGRLAIYIQPEPNGRAQILYDSARFAEAPEEQLALAPLDIEGAQYGAERAFNRALLVAALTAFGIAAVCLSLLWALW